MHHAFSPTFFRRLSVSTAFLAAFAFAPAALAAATAQQLPVVDVVCDTRLGTGSLTSLNDGGYVVTVGHVVIDPETRVQATQCVVGFISSETLQPETFYRATVEHAVFDERVNRDFAVLKLGEKFAGSGSKPSQPLLINEFAAANDPITLYGFPEGSRTMQLAAGAIKGFRRGEVISDAPITPGYSGGPAIDSRGHMVAVAERVNYSEDSTSGTKKVVDYDLGDVLALITWLDTFGYRAHDKYLTHADSNKFDGAHLVYRVEQPGCTYIVRTKDSSSVYCLLNGPYRLVFPSEAVYFSWYPDFSGVKNITGANMSEYQLIGNLSLRAGSLVKIQTDPKVYVVTDSIGTIRWVPTEALAKTVFGDDWAKKVRDVPVEYFLNYHEADPLQ